MIIFMWKSVYRGTCCRTNQRNKKHKTTQPRKKIFETQTRVVQYGDQIPVMGGDRPQQGDETRREGTDDQQTVDRIDLLKLFQH